MAGATILLGMSGLGACAARRPDLAFYHRAYRERYAITAEELKTLQFYISEEVLAHAVDGSPGATPEQVVIVSAGTPGLVREAGPDWLRVAFTPGGPGVLFRTRADQKESAYLLATTTESGEIALVSTLRERIVSVGGRRYKVLRGAEAHLVVNADDFAKLIEKRPHAEGLQRE